MGVGTPQDLLEAIRRGIDLFDCVMPTRNGRNALAFTDAGPLRLRNLMHQRDARPLEEGCPCPACRHSRGYLRHLFMADEMLGPILLSLHNLTYYQRLLAAARDGDRARSICHVLRREVTGIRWRTGCELELVPFARGPTMTTAVNTTGLPERTSPPAEILPVLTFLRELSQGAPAISPFASGTAGSGNRRSAQEVRCTIVLKHPGAVRQMFWQLNKASFGEAYIYDDFDIEGDILAIFPWIRYLQLHKPQGLGLLRKAVQILRMPNQSARRQERANAKVAGELHSESRDKQAVQYHYDRPADFYALFLDKYMQYSCGYFATEQDDIETVQEQKLDYICRKLRLQPGERLIDFGCGWGGLITYAAKHFGVQATGVTISQEQFARAQRRIQDEGVQDRCRVEFCDYRQVCRSRQVRQSRQRRLHRAPG